MGVIITVLGAIGLFFCLFIMYATSYGIPGITKYDKDFKLLDMQLHYNSKKVYSTFEKIGVEGRNAYLNYLILDYFFIICLFIVMFSITQQFVKNKILHDILIILSLSRGVLDVFENTLLIILINHYPIQNALMANVCSWITTIKFIAMFLWIIGLIISVLFFKQNRLL